jgi:integrase
VRKFPSCFSPIKTRLASGTAGLGSNQYALGIPEATIQAILRHANVSTTSTYYTKAAPAEALAALAELESAIPHWGTESINSQLPRFGKLM